MGSVNHIDKYSFQGFITSYGYSHFKEYLKLIPWPHSKANFQRKKNKALARLPYILWLLFSAA